MVLYYLGMHPTIGQHPEYGVYYKNNPDDYDALRRLGCSAASRLASHHWLASRRGVYYKNHPDDYAALRRLGCIIVR